MRDLEDARDASEQLEAGGVDAGPDGAPRQKTLSAGGGSAFATAPPAADTEDFARRVRASKGEAIVLHGGLVEGGDTASRTAVLAGLGSAEGLVFCELASGPSDGSGRTMARASPAVAVSDDAAYFHGGYEVWDGGDDFADRDDLSVFDAAKARWACAAGEACDESEDEKKKTRRGGGDPDPSSASRSASKMKSRDAAPSPGSRDEHVAVITPSKIALGGRRQRAMIVFGGRDETDVRLDSVYAYGLEDGRWHLVDATRPRVRKTRVVDQGPFGLPAVIADAHGPGEPFPLARSGASAVVTSGNQMFIFGGFVVEGRLGFNVGELLALDLNAFEFYYPRVTGDLPVRRNKHSAVIDDDDVMWVWGGSVWDHTGGSATYASTATYAADLSDPRRVRWEKKETRGLPPSQRRMHAAVHRDGVMYVIGGEDYHSKAYLQDVHALDLKTLTWSQPAVAGDARGGRIRAAAAGVRLRDPAKALVGCGAGDPVPAITGELQPKNDKLVVALEEADARGPSDDALFAAAMGGKPPPAATTARFAPGGCRARRGERAS